MAKVIWTDAAIADLPRIFDYIAESSQSLDRADQVCQELLTTAYERLGLMPDSGAIVEELREFNAREIYRHGYRFIYVHLAGACYVGQCIHASRDLVRHHDPDRWTRIP